jgi:hypothetical protein
MSQPHRRQCAQTSTEGIWNSSLLNIECFALIRTLWVKGICHREKREAAASFARLLGRLLSMVPSCGIVQHFEIDGILRQMNVTHHTAADETVVHGGLKQRTRAIQQQTNAA